MYTFVASMFAYIYCLDCDHYPFCWGDCLNRCALEWLRYFGGDILEPDMIRQDPLDQIYVCASQSAAILSVTSVQGRLKQHENFWLSELSPQLL